MRNKYYSLKFVFTLFTVFIAFSSQAQDDLMSMLEESAPEEKTREVTSVFKGTRMILGHSTKTRKAGELEMLITHRFGAINTGSHELWGLDNSSVRIGLEYGITDQLNIGLGRSSFDKTFDGFAKYKVLTQTSGSSSMPVSLVVFTSIALRTTPKAEFDPSWEFKERLAYSHQLLISRKMNDKLSLLAAPILVIRNRPLDLTDEDMMFALGLGGRYKLTPSLTLNLEYYPRLNPEPNTTEFDSFSVGIDIETGGHVFQLHFTNSQMTLERAFVTETFDNFFDGGIHFGFNISRTFQVAHK